MSVREFAERVLLSQSLDEKLSPPPGELDDTDPGLAVFPLQPGRPEELVIAPRRSTPQMPAPGAMERIESRAIAHHIMANHELQALEVMGLVLCAFPEAPAEFRTGLVEVMADEQRHTRMHIERAAACGLTFGDLPVNGYIWKKSQDFTCPLDYLAGLPLVFEGANLDHTLAFAAVFDQAGDTRGAAVLRTIHKDEIRHVRFGIEWLRQMKPPGDSDWDTFARHLHWPLRPSKARGEAFQRDARLQAGLEADFVDRLESLEMGE